MPPLSKDYSVHRHPSRPPLSSPPKKSSAIGNRDMQTFLNFTHCVVYLWLESTEEIWFYPTRFLQSTINGYGWNGSRWVSITIPYRSIEAYY